MDGDTAKQRASTAAKNSVFYQPLPSARAMRLLELQTGKANEIVRCRLITVESFNAAPSYEALSYCWGSGDKVREIECDQNATSFTVTENVFVVLGRLRLENYNRLLWIDAMCINQHDLAERSQQVSIMRLIYAHASKVLIWLGVRGNRFTATIALMRSIARHCCDDRTSWDKQLGKASDYDHISSTEPIWVLPDPTDACWLHLGRFFDIPWFFRVWVIQELQSCNEVQVLCGEETVEWKTVALVAAWLRASPSGRRRLRELRSRAGSQGAFMGTSQVHFMSLRQLTTHQEAPFLRLLDRAMSFRSSDPRDKIYALLTHSAQRCACRVQHTDCQDHIVQGYQDREINGVPVHLDIDVDYSMSIVDLLRLVTLRSIVWYGSLETLNYAWKQRRERFRALAHLDPNLLAVDTEAYPSWVPQWDAVINNRRAHFRAYLYNACLGQRPMLRECAILNGIKLRGIVVDTVKQTKVALTTAGSFNDQAFFGESRWRSSEDDLVSLSRILVQDHKHHIGGRLQGVDALHERAQANIDEHFANFAAFVLTALENRNDDVFISLNSTFCHVCNRAIARMSQRHGEEATAQNCNLCQMGAFDICSDCYLTGKRCLEPKHTNKQRTLQGFWCRYDDAMIKRLARAAPNGTASEFSAAAGSAFDRRSTFSTTQGLTGLCPLFVVPGDIVVVLFGGRSPFVLRKTVDHYRLVSDCYVYGIMDGEVVRMWQDGDLETQDFELR